MAENTLLKRLDIILTGVEKFENPQIAEDLQSFRNDLEVHLVARTDQPQNGELPYRNPNSSEIHAFGHARTLIYDRARLKVFQHFFVDDRAQEIVVLPGTDTFILPSIFLGLPLQQFAALLLVAWAKTQSKEPAQFLAQRLINRLYGNQ